MRASRKDVTPALAPSAADAAARAAATADSPALTGDEMIEHVLDRATFGPRPGDRELRMLDLLARQAADLIERTQAEASRRASEERYRTLFDMGPVAIYSCDVSGVIREFNRRAAELWGRAPELNEDQWCGSYKLFSADGAPRNTV